jgi:hypothetical protein
MERYGNILSPKRERKKKNRSLKNEKTLGNTVRK